MIYLKEEFQNIFGSQDETRTFFAPGRVNLIGEHVDYNGGHVLPCALHMGTYVVARKRKDDLIRMHSLNFEDEGIIEVSLDQLEYRGSHGWANYPKGVISLMHQHQSLGSGADLLFYGNIPNGAGLSSSASIEMATAVCMNELLKIGYDQKSLVLLTQRAENEYVGVNCGIMDQFAVGFGKNEHAVLLDCDTLNFEYIPLSLEDHALVIINTNKKRGLADSAYNDRRTSCESALKTLQNHFTINHLTELSSEELEVSKHLLSSEEIKRAHHVITEEERTTEAAEALKRGDLKRFGELMKESHLSLRKDYEVTGKELDTLAEAAWNHPGTVGARMTGAGFGGCTVNLVKENLVDDFIHEVGLQYRSIIGHDASFYIVTTGDGAKEINKEVILE